MNDLIYGLGYAVLVVLGIITLALIFAAFGTLIDLDGEVPRLKARVAELERRVSPPVPPKGGSGTAPPKRPIDPGPGTWQWVSEGNYKQVG